MATKEETHRFIRNAIETLVSKGWEKLTEERELGREDSPPENEPPTRAEIEEALREGVVLTSASQDCVFSAILDLTLIEGKDELPEVLDN